MGWSRREEELLRRLYAAKASAEVMTGALGRSYGAIQVKACRMGITAKKPSYSSEPQMEGKSRNPGELARFRRLLALLVWCKLRTGLSSKAVVNAVLGEEEDRQGCL